MPTCTKIVDSVLVGSMPVAVWFGLVSSLVGFSFTGNASLKPQLRAQKRVRLVIQVLHAFNHYGRLITGIQATCDESQKREAKHFVEHHRNLSDAYFANFTAD